MICLGLRSKHWYGSLWPLVLITQDHLVFQIPHLPFANPQKDLYTHIHQATLLPHVWLSALCFIRNLILDIKKETIAL